MTLQIWTINVHGIKNQIQLTETYWLHGILRDD